MSSFVEEITLRQPICSECGPLGALVAQSDAEATGIAVLHDAENHSGYDPEGEDG
jgi:hypothetical protein